MELIKRIFKSLACSHNYRLTGSMIVDKGKGRIYFLKCESCGKTKREIYKRER